jgi:hypothetical protein
MLPPATICRPAAAKLLQQAENAGGEPTHARLITQAGQRQPQHPEVEFLDINLTKDSSLLLHAIHSPFLLLADFTENHTLLGFYLNKKIPDTRKLESFYETHFVERKNEARKPDENSSLRRLEFM